MTGFIAKLARFAVSKAAAFGYAVAVGVAGNIAFNYVQPHNPPAAVSPIPVSAPADVRPAADKPVPTASDSAPIVAKPTPASAAPAAAAAAATARPAAIPVTAPLLPAPPTVALPGADSLAPPALRPTALPSPPPSEARLHPPPAPLVAPTDEQGAAPTRPPVTAVLPPLDPPIEVASPPMPPSPAPATMQPAPAAAAAAASEEPRGLAVSDIWHPGRAVRKSLNWAGRQVPLIGDDDAGTHAAPAARAAATSAPIPLLPSAADNHDDRPGPARKTAAPGPGSGGLY